MQAGTLNEIISVYREVTEKTEYGSEENKVWKKIYTTRASVKYEKGLRIEDTNEIFFSRNVIFNIRIYHDIQNFDRIEFNSELYRILNIQKDKVIQRYIIETELINE